MATRPPSPPSAAWTLLRCAPAALVLLGCGTVDLGDPPADVNRCRPDRAFFVQRVWPEFLDKASPVDGSKRCTDRGCHDASSGRQLVLTRPTSPPGVPLPPDWDAVYKSVTNQMSCTDVAASELLTKPDGRVPHGGGRLIAPNGPEAQLVRQWVAGR